MAEKWLGKWPDRQTITKFWLQAIVQPFWDTRAAGHFVGQFWFCARQGAPVSTDTESYEETNRSWSNMWVNLSWELPEDLCKRDPCNFDLALPMSKVVQPMPN